MAQFVAINNDVEVNGETVLSVVDGMGAFKERALKILADSGITDPKPGQWYRQQYWLDAFRRISESTGNYTLFNIGKKIPENAQFPPEIDDIFKGLSAIDVAYHMNHRIGNTPLFDPKTGTMQEGIGHYRFKKDGDKKVTMECNNPYPCDFDRGIIEAMAHRFKPSGASIVLVKHDDTAPCRKKGHESCTYHVTW